MSRIQGALGPTTLQTYVKPTLKAAGVVLAVAAVAFAVLIVAPQLAPVAAILNVKVKVVLTGISMLSSLFALIEFLKAWDSLWEDTQEEMSATELLILGTDSG